MSRRVNVVRNILAHLKLPPRQHLQAIQAVLNAGPNLLQGEWVNGERGCIAIVAASAVHGVRVSLFAPYFSDAAMVHKSFGTLARNIGMAPETLKQLINHWDGMSTRAAARLRRKLVRLRNQLLGRVAATCRSVRDDQLAEMQALLGPRFLQPATAISAPCSKEVIHISAA